MASSSDNQDLIIHGPQPFEPLSDKTLGVLFHEILSNVPENYDVMVDGCSGRRLSGKQLLHDACNLAESLRRFGCTGETTVAICSENTLEYFTPVMASIMAATIMVPINPMYTPDELRHTLSITQPRIVFCSNKVLPKIKKSQERMGFIERIVVINRDWSLNGVQCLSDFVREWTNKKPILPQYFNPFDGDPKKQVCLILSSSGTTGLPKGVMLTHFNLATRMLQSRNPMYLSSNRVVTGLMPFFHSYGLIFGLSSIFNQHLTVMLERFNEDIFLKAIQDYRIQVVRVTPPLAIFMGKSPKVENYDLSCVNEFFCAAAPLSGETEMRLKTRMNIQTIHQAYGCTEGTLALTIMNLKDNEMYRPGSCGQVITYMQCIVRDPDTGKRLGPNQVGELCFKGPTVMRGYYRNPKETAAAFTSDGWLRTGDLGYYDDDRYFYIVDRLKELIKYNGYQVAPAELESILIQHPKISEAGVVGLPNERTGELPTAFVVTKIGCEVSERELQEFVTVKVSPQKRLRGGIIFVDAIPKNPSGKILRKELKKKLLELKSLTKSKL